jgi:3-phosphoshikimate 1-carboxyvinyltransferase
VDVLVPPSRPLAGVIRVPGDKSLGHRALLYAALREGHSRLGGLGGGADLAATARALRALGVAVRWPAGGPVSVHGHGFAGIRPGGATLDCGNSGTTIRLLMGLLAGRNGGATLDGDVSLRRRPMERVAAPLRSMGARVRTDGGRPPVSLRGGALRGGEHHLEVASAQVKGALLLAGLQAAGRTTVAEPGPSRDHTERALARLGAPVGRAPGRVWVDGPVRDLGAGPLDLDLPGDPSSAAFLVAAALLVPGSDIRLEEVCLNPGRTGALELWRQMGADLDWRAEREDALGEPVGWIHARASALGPGELAGPALVRAIDEVPVLAATAAAAGTKLVVADAGELRLKESDRLATIAAGLRALGAGVDERPDGLVVSGAPLGGGEVQSAGDHRVAMALLVAGLAARGPVRVRGWDGVATSYPEFLAQLEQLGTDPAEVTA